MATARDMVTSALKLIGALAVGETPSASELSDGLQSLNDMLDSWSAENLTVPFLTKETFTVTASQASYTMGPGGDFDTIRPTSIMKIMYQSIDPNSHELPVDIITAEEWADIALKNTQSTIPNCVYAENTMALETLNVYPVPSLNYKFVIYSQKPFTQYNASAAINLPPGYARAIKYNLALELAPEYGLSASQEVVALGVEAKENIKRQNSKHVYMVSDAPTVSAGAFNWITGE